MSRSESIARYNKSDKAKAAKRRYVEACRADPDKMEKIRATKRVGTKLYSNALKRIRVTQEAAENSRQKWTLEEERKLEHLYNAGITQTQIAFTLRRSLRSVEHKLRKLEITKVNHV